MGHGTRVLCRNRGEFGGLGGHVAKHRPGLPPGLVDHLLELADPALAELSGPRRLLPARAPAAGVLLLGARLLGARTGLVFRSHHITSNWARIGCPSLSGVGNPTPGGIGAPARGRRPSSGGPAEGWALCRPRVRDARSVARPRSGADAPDSLRERLASHRDRGSGAPLVGNQRGSHDPRVVSE